MRFMIVFFIVTIAAFTMAAMALKAHIDANTTRASAPRSAPAVACDVDIRNHAHLTGFHHA